MKGDVIKSITITDWDRLMFCDAMLQGSTHESVMPMRENIMEGNDDRNPIIGCIALVRQTFEVSPPEDDEEPWRMKVIGDYLCNGDPVAESIRDLLVAKVDDYPMGMFAKLALERLKEEADGSRDA